MLSPECLQMMQNGMASPDLVEDDRKTNLIVNYLPQTMTQVRCHITIKNKGYTADPILYLSFIPGGDPLPLFFHWRG